MEDMANQLVGQIGQAMQGTLSTDQINQSASAFATDVASALQSYGTTTSNSTGSSSIVV
jgi:hypothetical protein